MKRDTEQVLERFKDMTQKHANECVESCRAF
jgi:hypothetical protein